MGQDTAAIDAKLGERAIAVTLAAAFTVRPAAVSGMSTDADALGAHVAAVVEETVRVFGAVCPGVAIQAVALIRVAKGDTVLTNEAVGVVVATRQAVEIGAVLVAANIAVEAVELVAAKVFDTTTLSHQCQQ